MAQHNKLVIGLFGFGVVGEGLYKVLQQTPSLNGEIKKVCIKHPDKKRNAPQDLFTTSKDELLNDAEINVIVEVIDDADAAFAIVKTALLNGKSVVSASKKNDSRTFARIAGIARANRIAVLVRSCSLRVYTRYSQSRGVLR